MNTKQIEREQSELLTASRFPLIVLVVLIHSLPFVPATYFNVIASLNIYHLVALNISQNIAFVAVPCFFLISGFLFFKNIDSFTGQKYVEQLKKRIRTLLIPYVLWNLVFIVFILLKNYLFVTIGREVDDRYLMLVNDTPLELFWTADFPLNYPLWYLRDLICMVILTPLFYVYFRYLGFPGLLLLIILNIVNTEIHFPGLSLTAFTYFGMGAYFSIYKKNLLVEFQRIKYPFLIGATVFGILSVFFFDTTYFKSLNSLYVLFGVVTFFNLVYFVIKNEKIKRLLISLSASVFFIFCAHAIYIIEISRGFFSRLPLAQTDIGLVVSYFALAAITLTVCTAAYHILYRFCPSVMNALLGGRNRR